MTGRTSGAAVRAVNGSRARYSTGHTVRPLSRPRRGRVELPPVGEVDNERLSGSTVRRMVQDEASRLPGVERGSPLVLSASAVAPSASRP